MVTFKEKSYKNYGNCLEISNGCVDLLVTLDIGPRIIRYGFCGGDNMLYEDLDRVNTYEKEDIKEMFGANAKWYLYGGHRLWISPEYTETYFPDNNPVSYDTDENSAIFTCDVQEVTGLLFSTVVTLDDEGTGVNITHMIENCSGEPQTYAIWALTVLDKGGVELIPFNTNDTDLLPNRTLRAWPYTDFSDHRLYMGNKFVSLCSDSTDKKFKLGFDLRYGVTAYINKNQMFVKSFNHYDEGEYPDNGCSFETFTNNCFLECETLGEIGRKPDGSIVAHNEYWSLYKDVSIKDPRDEKEIAEIFEKYELI
ncbi:MAG: hypothetical protein IJK34_02180 [Clostridia bacterium]|nr:hypothetical protein [Clostridia bacterium]